MKIQTFEPTARLKSDQNRRKRLISDQIKTLLTGPVLFLRKNQDKIGKESHKINIFRKIRKKMGENQEISERYQGENVNLCCTIKTFSKIGTNSRKNARNFLK